VHTVAGAPDPNDLLGERARLRLRLLEGSHRTSLAQAEAKAAAQAERRAQRERAARNKALTRASSKTSVLSNAGSSSLASPLSRTATTTASAPVSSPAKFEAVVGATASPSATTIKASPSLVQRGDAMTTTAVKSIAREGVSSGASARASSTPRAVARRISFDDFAAR